MTLFVLTGVDRAGGGGADRLGRVREAWRTAEWVRTRAIGPCRGARSPSPASNGGRTTAKPLDLKAKPPAPDGRDDPGSPSSIVPIASNDAAHAPTIAARIDIRGARKRRSSDWARSAGASRARWTAADPSPQKSAASSWSRPGPWEESGWVDSRSAPIPNEVASPLIPSGTNSSRGPSQSRGSRMTLLSRSVSVPASSSCGPLVSTRFADLLRRGNEQLRPLVAVLYPSEMVPICLN